MQIDAQPVRPFSSDIGAHVDEWIEENICGYHAESTSKQYNIRSGRLGRHAKDGQPSFWTTR